MVVISSKLRNCSRRRRGAGVAVNPVAGNGGIVFLATAILLLSCHHHQGSTTTFFFVDGFRRTPDDVTFASAPGFGESSKPRRLLTELHNNEHYSPSIDDELSSSTHTDSMTGAAAAAVANDASFVRSLVVDEVKEGSALREEERRRREAAAITDPSDHLVTSLPYLDPDDFPTKHYAGHLPASSDDDKYLFYWLFEPDFSQKQSKTNFDENNAPLIIWLNGGPGCSSMDGLFLENGPFRLQVHDGKKWEMGINEHSWHTVPAWLLYIDQPVGTGLSFTKKRKYCKNDEEVNIDFHYFLEEFFLLHSDVFLKDQEENGRKAMKRNLFFSGESHAGHYIPSMIDYILKQNDMSPDNAKGKLPRVTIPVSGGAIGNGWVDPYNQYAVASAAYGMGLIDQAQWAKLDEMEKQCQQTMDGGNLDAGICFQLLDTVVAESHGGSSKMKVSQYDNRKWEWKNVPRTFPPGHKDVEAYLGGAGSNPKMDIDHTKVLEAIHATESVKAKQTYRECTDPPFNALKHQDGLGVVDELVRILDHESKVQMLFFNGMNDLICNHAGNEKLLDLLPWKKAEKWTLAKRYAWDAGITSSGNGGGDDPSAPDGYMKEHDNLLFLKLLNSGHMVPMDLPETALEMMRTFVSPNDSFLDAAQRLGSKDPNEETEAKECEPCPTCETTSGTAGEETQNQEQQQPSDSQRGPKIDVNTVNTPNTNNNAVDQTPVVRAVIFGGWMGALVAVVALLLVNHVRNRSRNIRPIVVERADDYEYEMGGGGGGGGAGGTSNGNAGYRDDPAGGESSSVGSRGSRGSSSRGSSSQGAAMKEII